MRFGPVRCSRDRGARRRALRIDRGQSRSRAGQTAKASHSLAPFSHHAGEKGVGKQSPGLDRRCLSSSKIVEYCINQLLVFHNEQCAAHTARKPSPRDIPASPSSRREIDSRDSSSGCWKEAGQSGRPDCPTSSRFPSTISLRDARSAT